jgi:hypothetical protein
MEIVSLVRPEHGITLPRRLRRRWCKFVMGSEHHGKYINPTYLKKSTANACASFLNLVTPTRVELASAP